MTIYDDYRTVVDFWRIYKRIDTLRRELGGNMWPEALRICADFGEQRGSLAKRLVMAMLDEAEERMKKDDNG